jgi:putative ABC transport system permease protein
MNTLIQDLRHGLRLWRKNPFFTILVVLTLALGIGANTAIFSVINTVLLNALPFKEQRQLVRLGERHVRSGADDEWIRVSYPTFVDWKTQSGIFTGITVFDGKEVSLTFQNAEPARLAISAVSEDYFVVGGVMPAVGRPFLLEEFKPGAARAVVISYALWKRGFDSRPEALGQQVRIEGRPYTVVGIMPVSYRLYWEERPVEGWIPMTSEYAQFPREARDLSCLARLKPGIRLERVQSDMALIGQRLATQYPKAYRNQEVRASQLKAPPLEAIEEKALWILLVSVGLVLCIACVNVANLLLSRAMDREREISIRAALGADSRRILRQLLTESWLLAALGGLAGLLLASWGVNLINSFCAEANLFWPFIRIDWPVLGFTLLLTLLVGTLFGLAPAWHASKVHLQEGLRGSSRGMTTKKAQLRLKSLLVVAEVSLSLVLLVGAFLLMKSFYQLLQVPLGFRTDHILTTTISLSQSQYPENSQRMRYFEQALDRIRNLPGVESAALTSCLPLSGSESLAGFITDGNFQIDPEADVGSYVRGGFLQPTKNSPKICWWRAVSPDYFKTMGIRLQKGRTFTDFDNEKGAKVVVLSEALARRHWANDSPVGKQVYLGDSFKTVIGVVDDIKHRNPDYPPLLEAYLCAFQPYEVPLYQMHVVVRTSANPVSLSRLLKKEVFSVDPDQPVSNIRTMEMVLIRRLSLRWFLMIVTGLFAGMALVLASVGLYGVMSYFVSQRTQEMGIRMAIGASRWDVLALVLKQGMGHVLIGLGCGLLVAWGLTRWLSSQLFGVSPTDTLIFVSVPVLLALVSSMACYFPARRAMQVDPMEALRYE